jgi:hypothetical protein
VGNLSSCWPLPETSMPLCLSRTIRHQSGISFTPCQLCACKITILLLRFRSVKYLVVLT